MHHFAEVVWAEIGAGSASTCAHTLIALVTYEKDIEFNLRLILLHDLTKMLGENVLDAKRYDDVGEGLLL